MNLSKRAFALKWSLWSFKPTWFSQVSRSDFCLAWHLFSGKMKVKNYLFICIQKTSHQYARVATQMRTGEFISCRLVQHRTSQGVRGEYIKKTAFVGTRCHMYSVVLSILLIKRLTSDTFPPLHRWCRASILMASKLRGSFCNNLKSNKRWM